MDLIWRKNRKKIEPQKSSIIHPSVRYKKYLDSIIQEKSFDIAKIVEYGYFGGTIILKPNETDTDIKVKIVKTYYVGEEEMEWKKFNHRNIMPLLNVEYLQKADSYLFYSPVEEISLQEKIEDKLLRKDPLALTKLINWLKEVGDVVQYLHSTGYAYMNIQAKSIIITKDDAIKISDFHYVSSTNNRTNRYGLYQPLRSPEAFFNYGGTWPSRAKYFDTWSLGIMIIELFTGSYLSKKLPKKVCTWTEQVYPVIYDVLKKRKFSRLVAKTYPKAHGTVNLKTVRYLAAHALTFEPTQRPSAKDLYHLLIMMDLQKKFFTEITMEFQKNIIWKKKYNSKKLQKHYSRLSAEDTLELMKEDNLRLVKDKPKDDIITRSILKDDKSLAKEENNPFTEFPRANVDEDIERGSTTHAKKVHFTINNSLKQKSKKEKAVLLKVEDQVKLSYTAFTLHDRSSFETSIFDIKSVSSELSGLGLDKKEASSSVIEQFEQNIENSRLHVGDASPKQGIIQKYPVQNKDEDREITMKNENEEKHHHENFVEEKSNINTENNKRDRKEIKERESSEIAAANDEELTDEWKIGDENETTNSILTTGKHLMRKFLKWGYDCFEMTNSNYDIRSPNNYLHNLSKKLTK